MMLGGMPYITAAQDNPGRVTLCDPDNQLAVSDWRISKALKPDLWPTRLSCMDQVLRIAVHPGDAYDPNPGENPTERVEIQVRREIVRFDEPVWYRFGFRLLDPWQGTGNRTVIHQVKQDIASAEEAPRGACPSANPLFKIEARPAAAGAEFLVKVRGVGDCREGGESATICGPWAIGVGDWHQVRVLLRPSHREGASDLRVGIDGRDCPRYSGRLGYRDQGFRDASGRPVIDAQPRFGIYRDALPGNVQSIEFAGIRFWSTDPSGDPAWNAGPTGSSAAEGLWNTHP